MQILLVAPLWRTLKRPHTLAKRPAARLKIIEKITFYVANEKIITLVTRVTGKGRNLCVGPHHTLEYDRVSKVARTS